MDALCTLKSPDGKPLLDAKGQPVQLTLDPTDDFLARQQDSLGKGDFQGCSEFNPLLIFSQQKNNEFDADKDKSKRNLENAPNRRVLVLLFRPGSKVLSSSGLVLARKKESTAVSNVSGRMAILAEAGGSPTMIAHSRTQTIPLRAASTSD